MMEAEENGKQKIIMLGVLYNTLSNVTHKMQQYEEAKSIGRMALALLLEGYGFNVTSNFIISYHLSAPISTCLYHWIKGKLQEPRSHIITFFNLL
jgi:hypothetical protein